MLEAFVWQVLLPLTTVAVLVLAASAHLELGLLRSLTGDRSRVLAMSVAGVLALGGSAVPYALGSPPGVSTTGRALPPFHLSMAVYWAGAYMVAYAAVYWRRSRARRNAGPDGERSLSPRVATNVLRFGIVGPACLVVGGAGMALTAGIV